MKKYIIPFVISLLFLGACAEQDNEPALTRINASKLNALPFESAVLAQPADGASPLLCTVSWTATQFFLNGESTATTAGPVSYTLQIAKMGTDFANAETLGNTSSLFSDVLIKDINTLLTDVFGVTPGETFNAELRLVATYGEGVPRTVVSDNVLKLSLSPYEEVVESALKAIYMCGDMNGWNNTNTDFIMFREDSDPANLTYTYTGRIAANCYYKFCPQDKLGTYEMYCTNGDGTVTLADRADGSFLSATDSYKKITLNLSAMTCTVEEVDMTAAREWEMINFVGDFCAWGDGGTDPAMTRSTYDPHIWSLTVLVDNPGYGVKFRASHSWDNRWCPLVPTNIPYGVAKYNNEQDNNISIQDACEYDVKFNDLTGHYIVMAKK